MRCLEAKRWPDAQEADEATYLGKAGQLGEVRYLHGTIQRISDNHKREGRCAMPGEISLCV